MWLYRYTRVVQRHIRNCQSGLTKAWQCCTIIDVMKLMKKVKIDSRSFYLSQSIYILQGSHTVENSKHATDDANMRCQSST